MILSIIPLPLFACSSLTSKHYSSPPSYTAHIRFSSRLRESYKIVHPNSAHLQSQPSTSPINTNTFPDAPHTTNQTAIHLLNVASIPKQSLHSHAPSTTFSPHSLTCCMTHGKCPNNDAPTADTYGTPRLYSQLCKLSLILISGPTRLRLIA